MHSLAPGRKGGRGLPPQSPLATGCGQAVVEDTPGVVWEQENWGSRVVKSDTAMNLWDLLL